MLHIASGLVLALIAVGLFNRRRPSWHPKFMIAAFTIDLLLVLYIEFTRQAVEKVASNTELLLWVHAGISLGVLGCYVGMILLGRKMLAGEVTVRSRHRDLGLTFCVLRTLNYITAMMI